MARPRLLVLTLACLLGSACGSSSQKAASTTDATSASPCASQHGPERYHGGIVSIALRPFPDGPALVVTSMQDTFVNAVNAVPVPMPEPIAQPATCCPTGGFVELGLSDGYRVVYGPCRLPPGIESAREKIAAIPNI